MTYEKMTGAIDLEELEVGSEEINEASAGRSTIMWNFNLDLFRIGLCD